MNSDEQLKPLYDEELLERGRSSYNGMQTTKAFSRSSRRSLNVYAPLLCVFLPWALFTITLAVMSLEVHFYNPHFTRFIFALGAVAVLACLCVVLEQRMPWSLLKNRTERVPSWVTFLCGSLAMAYILALLIGDYNYQKNTKPACDVNSLTTYTDISPTHARGDQLLDAGIVDFASGAKLDVSKSMGFKNDVMYCVVPISQGNATLATYDFWAVGTDCCSGYQADFHCDGFNDPRYHGGLRLVRDADRAFYRLAVQQAEATHNIKAVHPLFFHWVREPQTVAGSWNAAARTFIVCAMVTYFFSQLFVVAMATVFFSKLGFS